MLFRHEARPGAVGSGAVEISGHFHPKATMPTRCGGVTRPCFLTDGRQRLILPAFGAYTGGLDVADPAIAALLPRGGRAFLLGRERLYALPLAARRAVRGTPAGSPARPAHQSGSP
jgi:metallophosphoesterase superfamily enzyme